MIKKKQQINQLKNNNNKNHATKQQFKERFIQISLAEKLRPVITENVLIIFST